MELDSTWAEVAIVPVWTVRVSVAVALAYLAQPLATAVVEEKEEKRRKRRRKSFYWERGSLG